MIKKILSIFLSCQLVLSSAPYLPHAESLPQISVVHPGELQVPERIGKLQNWKHFDSDKTIIHIQDAHSNFLAQENLANIIHYLQKTHGVNLIGAEGGVGELSLDEYRNFISRDLTIEAVRSLMREGKFAGSEFAVISGNDLSLFGVEDEKLFFKNLWQYYDVLSQRELVSEYVKKLSDHFRVLMEENLNAELLSFSQSYQQYVDHQSDQISFFQELFDLLGSDIQNLDNYPYLMLFHESLSDRQSLDLDRAYEQAESLLERLGNPLTDQQLDELEQKSLFSYVVNLAKREGLPEASYQLVDSALRFLQNFQLIDFEALMKEAKDVSSQLMLRLSQTEEEKTIIRLLGKMSLLESLLTAKASRDDINQMEWIEVIQVVLDLEKLLIKNGYQLEKSFVPFFRRQMRGAKNFYQIAKKRDQYLVENLLKEMDRQEQNVAFLIAGGYHTDGLIEECKKKNINFAVISPQLDLGQKNTKIEGMIYESIDKYLTRDPDFITILGSFIDKVNFGFKDEVNSVFMKKVIMQAIEEIILNKRSKEEVLKSILNELESGTYAETGADIDGLVEGFQLNITKQFDQLISDLMEITRREGLIEQREIRAALEAQMKASGFFHDVTNTIIDARIFGMQHTHAKLYSDERLDNSKKIEGLSQDEVVKLEWASEGDAIVFTFSSYDDKKKITGMIDLKDSTDKAREDPTDNVRLNTIMNNQLPRHIFDMLVEYQRQEKGSINFEKFALNYTYYMSLFLQKFINDSYASIEEQSLGQQFFFRTLLAEGDATQEKEIRKLREANLKEGNHIFIKAKSEAFEKLAGNELGNMVTKVEVRDGVTFADITNETIYDETISLELQEAMERPVIVKKAKRIVMMAHLGEEDFRYSNSFAGLLKFLREHKLVKEIEMTDRLVVTFDERDIEEVKAFVINLNKTYKELSMGLSFGDVALGKTFDYEGRPVTNFYGLPVVASAMLSGTSFEKNGALLVGEDLITMFPKIFNDKKFSVFRSKHVNQMVSAIDGEGDHTVEVIDLENHPLLANAEGDQRLWINTIDDGFRFNIRLGESPHLGEEYQFQVKQIYDNASGNWLSLIIDVTDFDNDRFDLLDEDIEIMSNFFRKHKAAFETNNVKFLLGQHNVQDKYNISSKIMQTERSSLMLAELLNKLGDLYHLNTVTGQEVPTLHYDDEASHWYIDGFDYVESLEIFQERDLFLGAA